MNSQNKKGFSLTEVIIVIAIIGILASIVSVSLSSVRKKAKASSVFQSLNSVTPMAYKCLLKNVAGVYLFNPKVRPGVCSSPDGTGDWPDISGTGWDYANNFWWCDPNYTGTTTPAMCQPYQDGVCGGTSKSYTIANSGTKVGFCYKIDLDSGSKHIWCTANGCQKQGF